jgi:hypothetical protein
MDRSIFGVVVGHPTAVVSHSATVITNGFKEEQNGAPRATLTIQTQAHPERTTPKAIAGRKLPFDVVIFIALNAFREAGF